MRGFLVVLTLISLVFSSGAAAETPDLPLPRFVSIKSSKANLRSGPGLNYPIKWIVVKSGIPVEVIAEFEQWRKVRDMQGDEGWIHRSMLSGKRMLTIMDYTHTMYRDPALDSYPVALVDAGVQAEIEECEQNWCSIKAGGYSGWVERDAVWGLYPEEIID